MIGSAYYIAYYIYNIVLNCIQKSLGLNDIA